LGQLREGSAVIDINDQMQFEAVKPTHRRFAPLGDIFQYLMAVDASVMTNGDGGRVNKSLSRGLAFTLLEISTQGEQGHKALRANSLRKSPFEMAPDIAQVIALEVTIARLMEINDDGHDLTDRQAC
jgi:hypothetical protein